MNEERERKENSATPPTQNTPEGKSSHKKRKKKREWKRRGKNTMKS